ncbi:MAG TPA: V-type ATP synthase subunit B [Planctomycetota bacterium]|nr:V-type ATP synthase subunit B [Planctomycetota bacterium]HRR78924.1 V-type ATP synthase subunit B [Planctomycetota bacterium]HRT92798.1 V-type ATP synthase subunit B [Planctomycetota bacterium]
MPVVDHGLEYVGLEQVNGPLIFIEAVRDVGYGEVVEIADAEGTPRLGTVLDISDRHAVVQVLEGTSGLAGRSTRVRFLGKPLGLPVSRAMLGRVFDGIGRPLDGGPAPLSREERDINGQPVNPFSRRYPRDFIQTGISAIDGMNTLVRGQKLPIFSGSGLPHDRIAAQIARQARLLDQNVNFAIVFGAMGVKHDVAQFFTRSFEESGVLGNVALFLSLASAPSIERLLTPRSALTLAEHLAFDCGLHVLVLLTDMTNYCESLREIGTARGEIPARKGYPGYLYSDLASIYERAGRVEGSEGSITQMAILTMPSDDISHPVPDLTGYITEGQIVLERDLFQRGIYPPIAGLPSLSRLMKDGIGKGRTREDHAPLASQLFAAYAVVKRVRGLAAVIGEEELPPLDKGYLAFGEAFERRFLAQGEDENRTIEQTLDLGWDVLSLLPRSELHRISEALLDAHYKAAVETKVVERKETGAAGSADAEAVERRKLEPGAPMLPSQEV